MKEEPRQKTDRKRMIGLLSVSCAATLCFAGLYVRELNKEKKQEEIRQMIDDSELDSLRADYVDAVSRAELAEQAETDRTLVNDLVLTFLDVYFLLPDSREALLSGCEAYVSETAWRTVELLSESQDYEEADRELFYYQENCTKLEEEDGTYSAFAIFTIREIENGEVSDQSYMLAATVETDGITAQITDIETMTAIYFHAD